MDDHGSRVKTCAASLLACFLTTLPLASMTEADEQSAPAPNRVIEANRSGLARLTVELRVEGGKEPQTVELKATDGAAVGGILLPEQRVEYTISAYDAQGGLTNRGSGTLPGASKDDRRSWAGNPSNSSWSPQASDTPVRSR